MENPINTFIEKAKKVRLRDDASLRIRERLIAHARAHPVLAPSPYQRFLGVVSPIVAFSKRSETALVLVLFVALGGMTASATSGALPGDTLYPLKVSVVEPARKLLTPSPEAKAALQVSLVEARLSEVEQLVVKKELTPEVTEKSQERFDRTFRDTRDSLLELSKEDPEAAEKIRTSMSASFDAHDKILTTFGEATTTEGAEEARSFAEHLRKRVKDDREERERNGAIELEPVRTDLQDD